MIRILAQNHSSPLHNKNDMNIIRKQILNKSAQLIVSIVNLLDNAAPSDPGGSSEFLDDFSLSNAIRNVSENVP